MTRDGELILGFDVGGTKAVAVLARASGEVLAESRLDDWVSGDWEQDLALLARQSAQPRTRMIRADVFILNVDIEASPGYAAHLFRGV